jgi:hypothetical protein
MSGCNIQIVRIDEMNKVLSDQFITGVPVMAQAASLTKMYLPSSSAINIPIGALVKNS